MATAQVVVTDANNTTPAVGGLFDGLKFFLLARIPLRSDYVSKIAANGGEVIKVEERADYVIADHMKSNQCPVDSISYTFIDKALADGTLPNREDHRAGRANGTVREVGSPIPTKGTRTAFTAEDDKILWQWVEHCKKQGYVSLKGNEIYKQLEAKNARHTFQAWRDRYIKYLMDRGPPAGAEVTVAANPPPSPPTAQDPQAPVSAASTAQPLADVVVPEAQGVVNIEAGDQVDGAEDDVAGDSDQEADFTVEDFNDLLGHAADIENIPDENEEDAWVAWQGSRPEHSVQEWRMFYLQEVRPAYLEQKRAMKRAARQEKRKRQSEAAAEFVAQQQLVKGAAAEEDSSQQRPGSSGSQKLKRKLHEAGSPATDGQKKLRSEATAARREDERETLQSNQQASSTPLAAGAVSTQPIELISSDDDEEEQPRGDSGPLATSELNRAAQTQLEADGELARARAFLTSESYKTVQSQLREDASASVSPALGKGVTRMSSLPTSDLNRLAGKQLQKVSSEQQDQDGEPSPPKTPELAPLHTSNGSRHQPSQITPTRLLKSNGDLLTEANLASQQAQHQQSLLRGSDLPEDDEAQDQTEYINALQDLVKDPASAFVPHSSLRVDASSMNADHPSQGMSLGLDNYDFHPIQDLQMSSQQEIEEAFDGAINWPESPKASQRVIMQPDSVQFETQVEYPALPLENPDVVEQHGQPSESQLGEPAIVPQVNYPALTAEEQVALSEHASSSEDASESEERERRSQSPSFEKESSYVIVEQEEETSQDKSAIQDEIDLSIPEPEGGWERSSPAKGSVVVVREEIEQIEDGEGDVEAVVVEEEIVEVSSGSSSTSSSSESSDNERTPIQRSRRALLETQDIVNAETQQPDFDMPLPSDSEENSSVQEDLPSTSPSWKWSTKEDQAIIEGKRAGMGAKEIKEEYNLKRSPSAIRNRSAYLLKPPNPHSRQPIIGKVILEPSSELKQPRAQMRPASATILEDWMSEDEELRSTPSEDLASPSRFATSESQRNLPNIQRPPEEDIDSYINKMLVYGHQEQAIIDALKCTSMRPELADYVLLERKAGKGLPADVAGIWSEEEDRILEGGNARGLRALDEKHTWRELEERRKFLEEWRDEE